jgi:hypothetical protein
MDWADRAVLAALIRLLPGRLRAHQLVTYPGTVTWSPRGWTLRTGTASSGSRFRPKKELNGYRKGPRHPCLTSEQATLATEEARSLTSPRPQVPDQSMAATFCWSARGLALERPWHAALPWAATG